MKINKVLRFLLPILLLTFLVVQPVSGSWTYYEGAVPSQQVTVIPEMGIFNFIPYPNEYPSTPEGNDNHDIFEHLSGGPVLPQETQDGWPMPETHDGISIADPKSPINAALERTNIDKQRPYITSLDYFDTNEDGRINRRDKTAKEYFYGPEADPNISFIIVRETFDNWFTQYYSVYTSTVDLTTLSSGDLVQYVYKTTIKWSRNIGSGSIAEGKYAVSTIGNVRGTCEVSITPMVNQKGNFTNKKFFDYTTFIQG